MNITRQIIPLQRRAVQLQNELGKIQQVIQTLNALSRGNTQIYVTPSARRFAKPDGRRRRTTMALSALRPDVKTKIDAAYETLKTFGAQGVHINELRKTLKREGVDFYNANYMGVTLKSLRKKGRAVGLGDGVWAALPTTEK